MGIFHCLHRRFAILTLCFIGFSQQSGLAQTAEHSHSNEPCGFAIVMDQLEAQYPGFKSNFDALLKRSIKLAKLWAIGSECLYLYCCNITLIGNS